ncbi:MAG: MAPEG family protein [Hyphomicrobiaceae bacterium]
MPHYTALVTLLACFFLFVTGIFVAQARRRTGVKAPATTGHPDFERAYRVQMNTVEWMPIMLPALWLFALYVSDVWAALVGGLWIAGRVLYLQGYMKAADKRGLGFSIQALATAILWFGALAGIVSAMIRVH